jgi:hypothetical protein
LRHWIWIMRFNLRYSAISGIISFLLYVPLAALFVLKLFGKLQGKLEYLFIAVNILALVFFILFMYGFLLIASRNRIALLSVSSWLLIFLTAMAETFMMLPKGLLGSVLIYISIGLIALMAVSSILFGVGILRLKKDFKGLATAAGILNIVSGAFVFSILFAPLIFVIWDIIAAFEIAILFKADRKYRI